MAEKELKLKISADITELNTALGQMNTQIKSQLGSILDMGRQVGIAFTAIGGGIAAALGLSAKAFGEAQAQALKLDAALKSTANSIGLSRSQLDQLATSLSRVTAFDDDAITGAEALALGFTNIGRDVLPKAIEAAMNMSVALGEDLNSAMMKVGRALNDPSGLKAMKVMTTDQKELAKQLFETGNVMAAQAVILEALGRAYGGQAREEAKGFEGQLKSLNVEIHNFMEVVGQSLMPTIDDFVARLKPAVIGVTDWAKANPELVSELTLTAAGISSVMLALGPLLIALPTVVKSFGLLATAAGPIATVALGIGAAFAGWKIGEWISKISAFGSTIGELTFKMLGLQAIFGNSKEVIDAQKRAEDDLKFATEKLAQAKAKQLTPALNEAAAAHVKSKKEIDAEKKALDEHNKAIEKTLDAQENLTRVNEESAKQWNELDKWTKQNADHQIYLSNVIKDSTQPAVKLLIGSVGELTDKNKELDDAWKTLGGTSTNTLRKQADEAHEAYKRIANDATSTLEDVKRAWDLYEKKASEANAKIADTSTKAADKTQSEWSRQVSTIVTDFGKGVADIILSAGSLGEKVVGLFEQTGKAIARVFIENGVKAIINSLSGLADSIGGILGKILGGLTGGGSSSGGGGGAGGVGGLLSGLFGGVIGAGIGLLVSAIGKLFGKDQNKIDDTKIVQEGWPKIWALQATYAGAPPAGSAGAETAARWDILNAGIGGWNEMVKHFKRKESADTQRQYIFAWIKAIDESFSSRMTSYPGATMPNMNVLPVQPLAQGGIVRTPTLAMIGESGPEAVIPLGRGRRGGIATAVHQTINIQNVDNLHSQRRMMDRINRHMVRQFGFAR